MKIRWTKYIKPTKGNDAAYGVCVLGNYIAVVGDVEGDSRYVAKGKPYIALLHKNDGSIVKEWIGTEKGGFINCISISGKLYAIGTIRVGDYYHGVIYVFDKNLNVLARIIGESPSRYHSLAYDGEALYVAGKTGIGLEVYGLVEKIVPGTGIIKSKKTPWELGWIFDIGVEPSTGRIWAGGFYLGTYGVTRTLVVVFDSDLEMRKVLKYPPGTEGYVGVPYSIAFDGKYVYVAGEYYVAKFSADGELVAKGGKGGNMIMYGYGYLYTFGVEKIGGYYRHVLYIYDTDLNLAKSYVLSENVDADSYFYAGRPALEGNNLYVAGYDYALGDRNLRIVVYSLSL